MYGWRETFVILGLPGLALAGVAWLTLIEPRKRASCLGPSQLSVSAGNPGVFRDVSALCKNRTFVYLACCVSGLYFFVVGIGQWQASFLIRSFGFNTGTLGTYLALVSGPLGLLGSYVGGEIACRWAARNEPLQLKIVAMGLAVAAILSAALFLCRISLLAIGLNGLVQFALQSVNGPLFSAIQTAVPERLRATSMSLALLAANLIGAGLGPLAVGALSDLWKPLVHGESLRYALLAAAPGYLVVGWLAIRASKSVSSIPSTGLT
jgi:MFS family permease